MRFRVTLARTLATLTLALPMAVQAADLDEWDTPYGPRAESPYDDPRYRDLYAEPEPPPPPHYVEPRRHVYRDDRLAPMPPPRFSEAPRYDREPAPCLPRREVRARLAERGWTDFHDVDSRGSVVYLKAHRLSGQVFDLEIDRCSGSILSARPVAVPEHPYAWREGPYRRGY